MATISVREANLGIYRNNTEGTLKVLSTATITREEEEFYGLLKNSSSGTYIDSGSLKYIEAVVDLSQRHEDFNGFYIYADSSFIEDNLKIYGSNDGSSFKELEVESLRKGYHSNNNSDKVYIFKNNEFFKYRFLKIELSDSRYLYTFKPLIVNFEDTIYGSEVYEDRKFSFLSVDNHPKNKEEKAFNEKRNSARIDYFVGHYVSDSENINNHTLTEYDTEHFDKIKETLDNKKYEIINQNSSTTSMINLSSLSSKKISYRSHSMVFAFEKPIIISSLSLSYYSGTASSNNFLIPLNYYFNINGRMISPKSKITTSGDSDSSSTFKQNLYFDNYIITDEIVIEFTNRQRGGNTTHRFKLELFSSDFYSKNSLYLKDRTLSREEVIEEAKKENAQTVLDLESKVCGYVKDFKIKDGIKYNNNSYYHIIKNNESMNVFEAFVQDSNLENDKYLKMLYIFDNHVCYVHNEKVIKGRHVDNLDVDYLMSIYQKVSDVRKDKADLHETWISNFGKENGLIIFFEDEDEEHEPSTRTNYKEEFFSIVYKLYIPELISNTAKHILLKSPFEDEIRFKDNVLEVYKLSTEDRDLKLFGDLRRSIIDDLQRDEIEILTNQKNDHDFDKGYEEEYIGQSEMFENTAIAINNNKIPYETISAEEGEGEV